MFREENCSLTEQLKTIASKMRELEIEKTNVEIENTKLKKYSVTLPPVSENMVGNEAISANHNDTQSTSHRSINGGIGSIQVEQSPATHVFTFARRASESLQSVMAVATGGIGVEDDSRYSSKSPRSPSPPSRVTPQESSHSVARSEAQEPASARRSSTNRLKPKRTAKLANNLGVKKGHQAPEDSPWSSDTGQPPVMEVCVWKDNACNVQTSLYSPRERIRRDFCYACLPNIHMAIEDWVFCFAIADAHLLFCMQGFNAEEVQPRLRYGDSIYLLPDGDIH
jgi:hypothetical protein